MLKPTILLMILWASLTLPMVEALTCNGDSRFCDLRVDQYTFAGAHNAGTALQGHGWYRGTSAAAAHCWFRNQDKNFQQLLDGGIRFLDIDNCYEWWTLASCHGDVWTGNIIDGVNDLKAWLIANPNDIVMIHFNWDTDDNQKDVIAKEIKKMMEDHFPTGSNVAMSTYYRTHSKTWPTLREAITSNQRLFVLLDHGLSSKINHPDWAHITSVSGRGLDKYNFYRPSYQYLYVINEDGCKPIIENARGKCGDPNYVLVDVAAYGGHGLCYWDIAWRCSAHYADAVDACYEERKKLGKAVNIITADYATRGGRQNIPAEAQRMNLKNVVDFLE